MHALGAQYFARLEEIVGRILDTEAGKIDRAADIVAEAIGKGRPVYAWGTGGHDNRSAEELLWRAGGLACITVILDPGLQLIHGATKATKIERLPGYAKGVLDYYQVGKDDTLLLINSYGVNALTIDAVHACRERARESLRSPRLSSPPASRRITRPATQARRISTRSSTWRSTPPSPPATPSWTLPASPSRWPAFPPS
jgi:uncharacterized phosphosugar-binding protein